MYLSNDATKSTRVRVELLKRIAEIIKKDDELANNMDLIINKYEPRPMILLKQDRKIVKRITYAEAIRKWGNMLSKDDLEAAMRVAGREFQGRFSTVFGV